MIPQQVAQPWRLPEVTITVTNAPISTLLTTVANEVGVSIVLPPQLTPDQLITADYRDQPAQRIFEEIAKRIGLVAEYDGQLVTFVPEEQALNDFLMIRAGHGDPSTVQRTLQTMLGQKSTVELLDDRILISGDKRTMEIATRYAQHLKQGPDAWLLDVNVIRITETFRRQLGIDWNLRGVVELNTASQTTPLSADAFVSLVAEAIETGSSATLEQTATLYCLEGSPSRLQQGQRVPVPRFSTSPEGTTTTTGYDYITAGFELQATAQRVPDGVRLHLQPTLSSVVGYVQQAPITQQSTVDVTTVVSSGDWLIITGLREYQQTDDTKQLPSMPTPIFGTRTTTRDDSSILIVIQATRIYATN